MCWTVEDPLKYVDNDSYSAVSTPRILNFALDFLLKYLTAFIGIAYGVEAEKLNLL